MRRILRRIGLCVHCFHFKCEELRADGECRIRKRIWITQRCCYCGKERGVWHSLGL
jgi:hypothetical protein